MAATDFWSGAGGPLVSAGVGLIGLPFQIASQRRQQDITRSGIEAQLRAQNAALETNAMLSREGMYGQLGESLGARVFGQTAADLEFGRQQKGRELELGPFAEKQLAWDTERARRQFDLTGSALAREQSQREHRKNLEEKMAGYAAGGRFMFGPIGSVDVNKIFAG
jgi:hypothetical protein